jgi:hypothetical protein
MSVGSQVTAGIDVLFPMAFAAAKLLGDKKLEPEVRLAD